jgi:hypothetical protein
MFPKPGMASRRVLMAHLLDMAERMEPMFPDNVYRRAANLLRGDDEPTEAEVIPDILDIISRSIEKAYPESDNLLYRQAARMIRADWGIT